MERIFIQVASYRDPLLEATLLDAHNKAKHPERLVFCVAWQFAVGDTLSQVVNVLPNLKVIPIPYTESKGACWARNIIQQHYNDEEYTLQIDSHHIFIENWDEELILDYKRLLNLSSRPIITNYASHFNPFVPNYEKDFGKYYVIASKFYGKNGPLVYESIYVNASKNFLRARFYSAHFAFTIGDFCKEVQHDPDLFFLGEEISISVRAFTWGYDLFHPNKIYLWHYSKRDYRDTFWGDHKNWTDLDNGSFARVADLLEKDDSYERWKGKRYGFGFARTLEDYEQYAGIDFSKRLIHKNALEGVEPDGKAYDPDYFYNMFNVRLKISNKIETNANHTWIKLIFKTRDGEDREFNKTGDDMKQFIEHLNNNSSIELYEAFHREPVSVDIQLFDDTKTDWVKYETDIEVAILF